MRAIDYTATKLEAFSEMAETEFLRPPTGVSEKRERDQERRGGFPTYHDKPTHKPNHKHNQQREQQR